MNKPLTEMRYPGLFISVGRAWKGESGPVSSISGLSRPKSEAKNGEIRRPVPDLL